MQRNQIVKDSTEFKSKQSDHGCEIFPIHAAYSNSAPRSLIQLLTSATKSALYGIPDTDILLINKLENLESTESKEIDKKIEYWKQRFMDATRLCLWDEALAILRALPNNAAKGSA